MRQVSLREFRTRGCKALSSIPRSETILLAGQQGPAYFLVPVMDDIAEQDRDLRFALARASLRESWRLAKESGADQTTGREIDAEISRLRAQRKRKKTA